MYPKRWGKGRNVEMSETVLDMGFEIFIPILIMIFLILLMLVFYAKWRSFLPMLIIELFSLIIGIQALSIPDVPLTPYFQFFFLLFQTSIFGKVSIDFYEEMKR